MNDASGSSRLVARRAIEALRSGVPSREAVAALGSGHAGAEDRFVALLERTGRARSRDRGLLLGGGFGAGKSHLLEHLAHVAIERGHVVSRVVISKETPLFDPARVLRAAVESAVLPDGSNSAVADAAACLDPESPAFADLLRWAEGVGAPVEDWFPVTLRLFGLGQAGENGFAEAIVGFWAGERLSAPEVRRQARFAGLERPALLTVPARELARQRFRFLARLFAAAGAAGWVLLFDEAELIGRYSLAQRGRSYAELAGWLRPDQDDPGLPLTTVVAMTDDFDAAVLTARNDRELVPAKLRARQSAEWDAIADAAATAMGLIERDMLLLGAPDSAELDYAYRKVKALHAEAFGWDAVDVAGLPRQSTTRMRQYVRAWINEWDLVRLDPSFRPQTRVHTLDVSYREQPELESEEPG